MAATHGSRYFYVIDNGQGKQLFIPQPFYRIVMGPSLCSAEKVGNWILQIGNEVISLGCQCHHQDPNVELMEMLKKGSAIALEQGH